MFFFKFYGFFLNSEFSECYELYIFEYIFIILYFLNFLNSQFSGFFEFFNFQKNVDSIFSLL